MKKPIKFHELKYLRGLIGSKQEEFAKLIGVTSSQYSKKENGTQPWALDECKIVTDYINEKLGSNYTVDEIFLQKRLLIRH